MKLVMSICEPRAGARLRQEDRRRLRRGGSKGPESSRRIPRRRGDVELAKGVIEWARPRSSSSRVCRSPMAHPGRQGHRSRVRERELVCLIGANGGGQDDDAEGITGLQPIKSGTIHYDGRTSPAAPFLSCAADCDGPRDAAFSERSPSRKIWPGRLHAQRSCGGPVRTSSACTDFPPLKERRTQTAEHSPAASSRCWRWVAR